MVREIDESVLISGNSTLLSKNVSIMKLKLQKLCKKFDSFCNRFYCDKKIINLFLFYSGEVGNS